jgi:hypothetical protein
MKVRISVWEKVPERNTEALQSKRGKTGLGGRKY